MVIFVGTYFYANSSLGSPFRYIIYIRVASRGEFARAAADRLKSPFSPVLAFPGGGKVRGRQLSVFSGRLDLMIFSSVAREKDSAGRRTHRRRLYGMRSAKRAKRSYESAHPPATFLRWKFYTESKRKIYISTRRVVERLNCRASRGALPAVSPISRFAHLVFPSLNKIKFNCTKYKRMRHSFCK